jgi:hypothetical protein
LRAIRTAAFEVASTAGIDQPLQYLVQRIVESANEGASFLAGAGASADPISVLDELTERARAAVGNAHGAPKFGVLYDSYSLALATLRDIEQLRHWYPPHAAAAIAGFERATDLRLAAANGCAPSDWLKREGWPVVRSHAAILVAAMRADYADRMLEKVLARRSSDLQRTGHWIDFDDDVRHLLAALMGEGRPGTWVCERTIAACRSRQPRVALVQELRAPPVRFQVALSIRRVRSVRHSAAFGCQPAADGWPEPTSVAAGRALVEFRKAEEVEGNWAFVVAMDAHSRDHAVARARAMADELVAQLAASHRTRSFTLGQRALVWQHGRRIHPVVTNPPPVQDCVPRLPGREPRLLEAMAHLQHAREARSPVAEILHSWIALEALAYRLPQPSQVPGSRQRQKVPYDTLGQALPRIVALHGVRQGLVDLWHVVVASERRRSTPRWRDVEAWLGVTSSRQLSDVNRWFDVLAADVSGVTLPPGATSSHAEAALLAELCLASAPAFPRRQFELWRNRIAKRARMAEFFDRLVWDTAGQVTRLYALRNLTVHQGAVVFASDEALARAAGRLLDLVLEVLPAWLATSPSDPPGPALGAIADRASYVRSRWTPAHPGRVRLNADTLTRPGGDGINR